MSWTQRQSTTQNKKEPRYAIITGTAYPYITKGSNATNVVDVPLPTAEERKRFYTHAAVVLSDSDMDDLDGAEGAPLCVNHNRSDCVGRVHHSWIDSGRALQIVGRIPLNTERGRQVVADIRCGKLKGLSVGYGTVLTEKERGVHRVESKRFHEISLCPEPFFDGCNLTVGVLASSILPPSTYSAPGKLRNKNASLHNANAFCNVCLIVPRVCARF